MGRNHNIDAAISLTRDLNDYTKFSIMAMRGHYNITGPGQVLAWQFGFPYCRRPLRRHRPPPDPGETTSVDLSTRNEVDGLCQHRHRSRRTLPGPCDVQHSKKHPSVTVDPHFNCKTRSQTSISRSPWSVSMTGGCAIVWTTCLSSTRSRRTRPGHAHATRNS